MQMQKLQRNLPIKNKTEAKTYIHRPLIVQKDGHGAKNVEKDAKIASLHVQAFVPFALHV